MGAETSVKKFKTQSWDSCVNIVLVEGKNLITKDDIGLSDTYVKFKLGNEKYKSRVCLFSYKFSHLVVKLLNIFFKFIIWE